MEKIYLVIVLWRGLVDVSFAFKTEEGAEEKYKELCKELNFNPETQEYRDYEIIKMFAPLV